MYYLPRGLPNTKKNGLKKQTTERIKKKKKKKNCLQGKNNDS